MKFPLFVAVMIVTGSATHAACIDDLKAAAAKQFASGPMHITFDENKDGGKESGTMDFVPPKIFHYLSNSVEVFGDGQIIWERASSAEALKKSAGEFGIRDFGIDTLIDDFDESTFKITDLKCRDDKGFEGKNYKAIEYTVSAVAGEGSADRSVYLDSANLPVAIVADIIGGSVPRHHHVYRMTYDAALKIELPN